jgi:hypothetical protein
MRVIGIVAVIVAASSTAHADCEVLGVATLPEVEVYGEGERLQVVSIVERRIAVRPGRGNVRRDLRVLEPLVFQARTRSPIPWTVPQPASVLSGMLHWGPTVDLEDVREDAHDGVEVRAQVDDGVWLSQLHLPCDALAVGRSEGTIEPPAWASQRGPRWQPRGSSLWLHAEPDAGPSVRVDVPRGLPTPLVEVARRAGWVQLVIRFASGVALRGWARDHHLQVATIDRTASAWTPRAPIAPRSPCPARALERGEASGRTTLPVDTPVRARPDGPVWATVSTTGPFRVAWREGQPWARILRAPGVRSGGSCRDVLSGAWVPSAALRPVSTAPR